MVNAEIVVLALFGFVAGACFGSFFSMAAHRYPLMLARKGGAGAGEVFNLAWPPSHCPVCTVSLRWWQNLPLVSWLILRGRCGHCGTEIPARYLLLELSAAAIGVASALLWGKEGYIPATVLWCGLGIAILEFRVQRNLPIATAGVSLAGLALAGMGYGAVGFDQALLGVVVGSVSFALAEQVLRLMNRNSAAPSDVLFFAAVGAWGGPVVVPLTAVAASLILFAGLRWAPALQEKRIYALARFAGWAAILVTGPLWWRHWA